MTPRNLAAVLLALALLLPGCRPRSAVLTPAQFTKEYAAVLKQTAPEAQVEIVGDLELKVKLKDGTEAQSFLDNAYQNYRQDPPSKDDVIRRYVAALVNIGSGTDHALDPSSIVPVVKDSGWPAEMNAGIRAKGGTNTMEFVTEELNDQLVVVYAEDTKTGTRYFGSKDLEEAKIERDGLRKLACDNLRRILPAIKQEGAHGVYMVTAGGDYEASLVLLDHLWNTNNFQVAGDFVVAIPSRDMLFVTGTENKEGLQNVRKVAAETHTEATYRIVPDLFVLKNGKLARFQGQ